jgi:hypothetical protein
VECRLDDRQCWEKSECSPADFACLTLQSQPQLFEYALGKENRRHAELLHPILKACSDEVAGDRDRFADCLLDIADLFDEIPGFVKSVPGVQSLHQAAAKAEKAGPKKAYGGRVAEQRYGPFPSPPCEPKDYACVAYHYGELHRHAVGTEDCYDEQCSKKGFRPAWIMWPALKACGEEAGGDKSKFFSCLKGISSLLRSIAQQMRA